MPAEPLFAGLVVDEEDQLVDTAYIGTEPCYVVDDDGFMRHIPAEQVALRTALCEALAHHHANVLDIGQSSIHEQVNLGMLLEIPTAGDAGAVMKELLLEQTTYVEVTVIDTNGCRDTERVLFFLEKEW